MNRVSITYHSSSVKNFHQVNDVSLAISAFSSLICSLQPNKLPVSLSAFFAFTIHVFSYGHKTVNCTRALFAFVSRHLRRDKTCELAVNSQLRHMRELEKRFCGEKSGSTFARVHVACSHFKHTVALV